MAGLLSDVLPFVYSRADALKRRMGGLLSDPMGTLTQAVNDANDRAGGLLAQTEAATKEGLTYGPATQALANTVASAYNPMGITVYHGSPHKFAKFDSSKIGTGEGAQAYGHGLYLAESPGVAKSYQVLGGVELRDKAGKAFPVPPEVEWVANDIIRAGGDIKKVRADLVEHGKSYPWPAEMATKRLSEWEAAGLMPEAKGSLYKVDLPDSAVARMLDWDKPLSQQAPEVQSVLSMLADAAPMPKKNIGVRNRNAVKSLSEAMNGGDAYFNLGGYNNAGPTSQMLRQAGIPGIRYLDGGSRGLGGGTSNFVVFPGEEGLLKILERNGAPVR